MLLRARVYLLGPQVHDLRLTIDPLRDYSFSLTRRLKHHPFVVRLIPVNHFMSKVKCTVKFGHFCELGLSCLDFDKVYSIRTIQLVWSGNLTVEILGLHRAGSTGVELVATRKAFGRNIHDGTRLHKGILHVHVIGRSTMRCLLCLILR